MNQAKTLKSTILRPLLLILLCLLGVFPLDVILPSFPALAEAFQVQPKQIAYSVSFFAFGVAVAQLVIGPLSDRIGRNRLLLGGLAVSIAGATGCLLSSDYETFMAFRLLQAAGCGSLVLGQALIQDLYSGKQRNTMRIVITSASGLFISISPIAGAALQQLFSWEGSFTAFILIATFVIFLTWALLHETPALYSSNAGIRSYLPMLRDTLYIAYSLQATFAFACHFAFIVIAPLVLMDQLGLTPYQFSVVFIAYGLVCRRWCNRDLLEQSRQCAGSNLHGIPAYRYRRGHFIDLAVGSRAIGSRPHDTDDFMHGRNNDGTTRLDFAGVGPLSAAGRGSSVLQYYIAICRRWTCRHFGRVSRTPASNELRNSLLEQRA